MGQFFYTPTEGAWTWLDIKTAVEMINSNGCFF
jgi:hypothetical protein